MRRAPITCWLSLPFSAGDIDVPILDAANEVTRLVARLDAARNLALPRVRGPS